MSAIPVPLPHPRPKRLDLGRWVSPALRHPGVAAGGTILVLVILASIFAPLLGASDPRALSIGDRLAGPSAAHLLGTDALGRDLYSRLLYGGRISLAVGFFAALLSGALGTAIGLVGTANRKLDGVVMRVMDGLMSIPPILLAIALMAVAGASVQNVILAVTMVETPRVARMVRGVVLSLRELPYVEAAIASGSTQTQIMFRHLLPGLTGPLAVQATFCWAAAMLIEAALSFIGAGTPPSIPSWGNIMSDGKALWQIKPELVFLPALFLSASVLGVNLLGDGLRKALDPKSGGHK